MSEARKLIEVESPKAAFKAMRRVNEYNFSLGNSTHGPVGFTARVVATSPEEALEILKTALPEGINLPIDVELPLAPHQLDPNERGVVYITAYFNPEAVTLNDITDSEPRQVRRQ